MGIEKTLSAKEAVQVAEQYVKDTIAIMDVGRSDPQFVGIIDQLRDGMTRGGAEAADGVKVLLSQLAMSMGAEKATFIGLSVQTAEAARMWRRHRVIYRVHPGLADSLIDTDTRAEIPCEVFSRLPHPDPFIVFPEPLPAPISEPTDAMREAGLVVAEPPVFVGMRVVGLNEHEQLCSTADPEVRRLDIALAGRIRYEGLPVSHEEATIVVPLSGKHSIANLIEQTDARHTFGKITRDEQRRVYNLALSLLLYLCSEQRDSRLYEPEPGRRGKKRRAARKDQTVVDLGFDVGPALQAARRAVDDLEDDEAADPADSRRVRAHLRRAHWHTYWTGPRTDPSLEVRWLHPILVGAQSGNARPTVIDVRTPVGSQ